MARARYRSRREAEALFVADAKARKRWWAFVTPKEAGCWEWSGHRDVDGYGGIQALGGPLRAHRVSWIIANGKPIHDGGHVLHSCDNPPCVNPAHLSIDTNVENARDRARKGRTRRFNGERNASAKLTEEAVRDIRSRRAAGETLASIARHHRVSFQCVSKVASGERWRHVR